MCVTMRLDYAISNIEIIMVSIVNTIGVVMWLLQNDGESS